MKRLITALFLIVWPCHAAIHYVDSSVATSGNGLSWATAWKGFGNITGLAAGDIVYFSGGSTSQAYSVTDWAPTGGTSGNPITYAVGQDAGHNGIVTITSSGNFLNGNLHDVTIDGNVGGLRHWQVNLSNYFWEGSGGTNTNVTLRYIDIPGMGTGGAGFHWATDSSTNIEIDHCSIVKDNNSANIHDFIFYGGGGNAAGAIKVHDNYIQYPYSSSDHSLGDDMWIWPAGVDFYNNTMKGAIRSTYSFDQHSDGFQSRSSHIHVFDNTIIDPGESVYYEDSNSSSTASDILIYNNLIVRSYACNGGAQRIFDMNPEGAGSGTTPYVDMVIANNTVVDQASPCIFFTRVSGAGSYTRVYVTNNIQYPSDSDISADAGVTVSNNYANNTISFASYVHWGGATNNLHLVSGDTAVIGQGRDMSSYYTIDFAGLTRVVPWDIGAYAFNSDPPSGVSVTTTGNVSISGNVSF